MQNKANIINVYISDYVEYYEIMLYCVISILIRYYMYLA